MAEELKCRICGANFSKEHTHCPNCLSGRHEECDGTLEPIAVWVKQDDTWDIILRCRLCGEIVTEAVCQDDNPIKIMSIASKPIASPPFPIEKLNEMTDLMVGNGTIDGYYYDKRK